MILNEKSNNKNKNITAIVKYLDHSRYNVKITGVCEGIDVNFQDVRAHQHGENDIQLDISENSIFKAKYYLNIDGNIRVLKKDGSITSIVKIFIL
jgi:transcription termination factor Rho